MGLTIHWTLSTPKKISDAMAKELCARTAEFARKIGCTEIDGPQPGGPDECKLRRR